MSRVIVAEHLTLDGVMQAPGRADEDTRDGFTHGGWARARSDAEVGQALGKALKADIAKFIHGNSGPGKTSTSQ